MQSKARRRSFLLVALPHCTAGGLIGVRGTCVSSAELGEAEDIGRPGEGAHGDWLVRLGVVWLGMEVGLRYGMEWIQVVLVFCSVVMITSEHVERSWLDCVDGYAPKGAIISNSIDDAICPQQVPVSSNGCARSV